MVHAADKPPGPKTCRGCSDGGSPMCEIPSWCSAAELAQQWHPYVLLVSRTTISLAAIWVAIPPTTPAMPREQGDNYTQRVDVHAGQAQPFLVTVHVDADMPGGTYRGTITIRDGSGTKRSVTVSVEVWDFALPAAHSLPTIWGWDDHRYEEFYCVTRTPISN